MERTLFSVLSIVTLALAYLTWADPEAADNLYKMVGVKEALAQSPGDSAPDPKRDPFNMLPKPNMPVAPTVSVRPDSWPGSAPDYPSKYGLQAPATPAAANGPLFGPPPVEGGNNPPSGSNTPPNITPGYPSAGFVPTSPVIPTDPPKLLEAGQVLVWVGPDVIVAGDLLPVIDEMIATKGGDNIAPTVLEQQKKLLLKQFAMNMVETKLIYADAKRTVPVANFPKIEENLAKEFEKSKLKELLKQYEVTNTSELDVKLHRYGSSLEKQKKTYQERMLATSWLQQQIKTEEEPRRDELLAYYNEHRSEYEFGAKARWEHVAARFERFPDKGAAYQAIAEWGNDILKGVPLAEVAKARSQDGSASQGGQHDWTGKGSLVSEALDQAIFTLPVGSMSKIIEDQQGFHIVRVVERKDAGRMPFEETQAEIRKKFKNDHRDKQVKDYIAKLRERTPVKTIWDNADGIGSQLSERPGVANPR